MMIFVAGTFLHYAEHRTHKDFLSVVDGLWWATQTITSVGYGDIVPISLCGKLFAGVFMLFAVIIYVPVFSIGTIFSTIYQNNVTKDDSIQNTTTEEESDRSPRERKLSRVSVRSSINNVVSYSHGNSRRMSVVENSMGRKKSLVYYNERTRKLSTLPASNKSRRMTIGHTMRFDGN